MSDQQKKFHTKYPGFILGIDAKAVIEMGLSTNCLDNKPWWWFEDNGASLGLSDEVPNSKLVNSRLVIRQRNRLEKDESVLQILPYTLIGYARPNGMTDVTTYFRKKGQGEQRMAVATNGQESDVRSIGWGGHIEVEDLSWEGNGDIDLWNTILCNITRELEEECKFIDTRTGEEVNIWGILDHKEALKFRGFIYDTRNEVGRLHLAVVNLLTLPDYIKVVKRENEHLDGPVLSHEGLKELVHEFEPWSELIISDHDARADAVHTNLAVHEEQYRDAQYHRLAAEAGQADSVETPATILHETVLSETLKADAS
jgi:predicted NUDIX family phosphoesterase